MSDEQDQRQSGSGTDPEERAVSGNPDTPPQEPDHNPENDRELLRQGRDEEEERSGKPAADGAGGSDQPGTTLPGYG
jgi:hypothetical protein